MNPDESNKETFTEVTQPIRQVHELEHFYDTAPIGLCLMDTDLRFVRINEWLAAINGRPVSDHIGKTLSEVIPEIASQVESIYLRVIESGEPALDFEVHGFTPAEPKLPKDWLVSYYPFKADDGAVEGVSTVVQDITGRKQVEKALQQSEERFRTLCENAPVMIDAFDQQGKCLFVNRELEKTLGRTLEEIIAVEDPLALFYPDRADRDRVIESIRRADGIFREYSVLAKDGSTRIQRWADFRLPTGTAISIGHDITERKRAEATLRESEERLAGILRSAMDAIITIDDQRRIVLFNEAAENVFRCTSTEVTGKAIDRFLSEDFRNLLASDLRDVAKGKTTKHYLWTPRGLTAIRADGEEFAVEATISQVEVEGQKLYTIILRDVEERNRAEAKLNKLQLETAYLREEINSEHGFGEIIGRSSAMKKVFQDIERIAGTDTTVLLTGETGTGKELIARAIHRASDRKEGALIRVNCAAMPSGLVESELFGHEKGAFTGAIRTTNGRFELAHHGTIFLDEIGALPVETQAKLLRVLQEKEFERVGGTQTLKVDVRVIAATSRDLQEDITYGAFRPDLFYRLNVFPIHLAPLRERSEDIPPLSDYFVRKFSARIGKKIEKLTPSALKKLLSYTWPGNVRELANILERAVILCDGRVLQQEHIQVSLEDSLKGPEIPTLEQVDREHILNALEKTSWVVGGPHGAATLLGLKRTTLLDKMKKLGISKI